ncbi:hypothetical protein Y1Q_0009787 [Alligator mississippiensis]|uniref:Uncharacterized protein n=1 Tax=Alligator mississippiensis TaxID=8496 RepID=A0A151MWU8_ALLMI|nr:hypothetical protein Y1Q_0009787 [Alligator mississippiensis]
MEGMCLRICVGQDQEQLKTRKVVSIRFGKSLKPQVLLCPTFLDGKQEQEDSALQSTNVCVLWAFGQRG